jgi:hypothetical protein
LIPCKPPGSVRLAEQLQRRSVSQPTQHWICSANTNEGFGALFVFSILIGIAGLVRVRFLLSFSRKMVREAQLRKAYSR